MLCPSITTAKHLKGQRFQHLRVVGFNYVGLLENLVQSAILWLLRRLLNININQLPQNCDNISLHHFRYVFTTEL